MKTTTKPGCGSCGRTYDPVGKLKNLGACGRSYIRGTWPYLGSIQGILWMDFEDVLLGDETYLL